MNRRNFITTNLMTLPVVNALANASSNKVTEMNTKIKFYCPRWGANDSWDSFCKRVKEAGYDGVEGSVSNIEGSDAKEIRSALDKHGLEIVGQYYQSFETDLDAHAKNFDRYLRSIALLKPIFINSQTGKDFFSFDQNKKLI